MEAGEGDAAAALVSVCFERFILDARRNASLASYLAYMYFEGRASGSLGRSDVAMHVRRGVAPLRASPALRMGREKGARPERQTASSLTSLTPAG